MKKWESGRRMVLSGEILEMESLTIPTKCEQQVAPLNGSSRWIKETRNGSRRRKPKHLKDKIEKCIYVKKRVCMCFCVCVCMYVCTSACVCVSFCVYMLFCIGVCCLVSNGKINRLIYWKHNRLGINNWFTTINSRRIKTKQKTATKT